MTRGRAVLLFAGASTLAAVVACITGSGPGSPVTCTANADQSCSCSADPKGDGGTLCPAANAGDDVVCCAGFGYPTLSGASGTCTCSHAPVGCADTPLGCSCGLVAPDAGASASCNLPTTWPTCCKSGLNCRCQLSTDCGDASVVASCSSSDVGGGTCESFEDGCVCDFNVKDAAASCAQPTFNCCIVPASVNASTSCVCGLAPEACMNIGGAQPVASCTAATIADAARKDTCGFSSVAVPSCNPAPDASF